MEAATSTSLGRIAQGANRARLDLLLGHARYALDRAAAHGESPADFPLPPGADSLEKLFEARIARLGAAARRRLAREARKRLKASPAERIARYGAIGSRASKPAVDTLGALRDAFRQPPYRFTADELAHDPPGWPAPRVAGPAATRLELVALAITCVDDTREPGKDEIALAGIRQEVRIVGTSGEVDSERSIVAPIDLGKFRSGDRRALDRVLASFDLDRTPKLCSFDFFLAETDVLKGFQNELKEALNFLPDRFPELFTSISAGGAAVGAAPLLFPGAWPAYLVALVIVAGLLLANGVYVALRDDVFPPRQTGVPLPDAAFLFPGDARETVPETAEFAKFGGTYRLEYQWRLV